MTKKEKKKWIVKAISPYVIKATDEPHQELIISQGSLNQVLEDFYAQFLEDIQDERDRRNALALYFSVYQLYQCQAVFYLLSTLNQGGTHEATN
ncbi:hypothetical protein [Listeria innocua]|uniref:hypothetical protein n=1 Tax=Listeria innocua TaxID=1642 RepID=UPI001629580D|nr:hypothetical protein [Listeria innocua]MBC1925571.1 hypothetical protein [Listeria innocua]